MQRFPARSSLHVESAVPFLPLGWRAPRKLCFALNAEKLPPTHFAELGDLDPVKATRAVKVGAVERCSHRDSKAGLVSNGMGSASSGFKPGMRTILEPKHQVQEAGESELQDACEGDGKGDTPGLRRQPAEVCAQHRIKLECARRLSRRRFTHTGRKRLA